MRDNIKELVVVMKINYKVILGPCEAWVEEEKKKNNKIHRKYIWKNKYGNS